MKKIFLFIGFWCFYVCTQAQVGIGTTTPNPKSALDLSALKKGLLLPRLTFSERNALGLSQSEEGMLIYQTDGLRGFYHYDGANWISPIPNGSINGHTLRWDGTKWSATTNLFNTGSAVGIGTQAPANQLHIHSNSAITTRIQLTAGSNMGFATNGLILGFNSGNKHSYLIQQENRPLYFSTNNIERMRIDSLGNVGINTTNPSVALDVNGSVKISGALEAGEFATNNLHVDQLKIGSTGTALTGIYRIGQMINLPSIPAGQEYVENITVDEAMPAATVHVSPGSAMSKVMIEYARVSNPGNVEIRFINMDSINGIDVPEMMFYITVIQ